MLDRTVKQRCPVCEQVAGQCFDVYGQCDGKIVYKYKCTCGCIFTKVDG